MVGPKHDTVRSRWSRLRRTHKFAHAERAVRRYLNHRGYQQAAAVTYFSVLSLVPAAMVTLSVTGYLLTGHPTLLGHLQHAAAHAVPQSMQPLIAGVVDSAMDHRFSLGLVGIAVAVYSGWNWITALRDALTGMWQLRRLSEPVLATVARDCHALLGLGLALLVAFGVTIAGSNVGLRVLGWVTRGDTGLATASVNIGSVLVTLGAEWLIFWWVLAILPRIRVPARAARNPALVTAIGFELLKRLGNVYLEALDRSPIGITLGSVVGALVFAYLVSRLMLLAAAWIATAPVPPAAIPRQRRPCEATVSTPARAAES